MFGCDYPHVAHELQPVQLHTEACATLIEFIQPVGGLFLGRIVNLDDVGDVIISVRQFARTRGWMAELPVSFRISRISPLNTCDVHTLFRSAQRSRRFSAPSP